jgi:hypothetical protein
MNAVRVVLVAGVVFGATAGAARASTPFGGDDTGFVPPDKATLKCESSVLKNAAKLTLAVSICHMKMADAGVKGKQFDEEGCETAAAGKYEAANGKLTCPACINSGGIEHTVISQLDTAANAAIYCDNTSGMGLGEDTGFVPANKAAEKCQNLTAKQIALLVGAVSKCHNKLAAEAMKGQTFDEEGCETTAVGKFNAFTGKLTNCPACLTALLTTLGQSTADGVDSALSSTYCASPSGAFIE